MQANMIAAVTASAVVLAGCASSSDDIAASYISPLTYENYSCGQLESEMERINVRVHQVAGSVDHAATNDKVAVGVGVVLFWPALLMIKGNGPEHEELARLKGEYNAANEEIIHKNCGAADAERATNFDRSSDVPLAALPATADPPAPLATDAISPAKESAAHTCTEDDRTIAEMAAKNGYQVASDCR